MGVCSMMHDFGDKQRKDSVSLSELMELVAPFADTLPFWESRRVIDAATIPSTQFA
jgi:hypothetical protein